MSDVPVVPLSAPALQAWLQDASRPAPLLLDVREHWEFEFCAIAGASLLPLAQVPAGYRELDPDREVVCICHHGMRSMNAANFLAQQGFGKVYNLTGGVHAWAREVDPSMPTY
jgi:rhodanese-related sulfurtransferase